LVIWRSGENLQIKFHQY